MRTLYHPALEDITVENILHALSDPIRAQIYMQLSKAECAQNCSSFLEVKKKLLPKSTLSQHFRVLREAGLVHSARRGVDLSND
jgi:DNA-binding transcriptional ArsR family regulator